MVLRSSSTPILRSLSLSSSTTCPLFPESPKAPNHHHFHPNAAAIVHAAAFPSCTFSPVSDHSDHTSSSSTSFRRTRSDGSLHSLLPPEQTHEHRQHQASAPRRCSSAAAAVPRRSKPVLESIPSFSMRSSKVPELVEEEEEEEEEQKQEPEKYEAVACKAITVGEGDTWDQGGLDAAGGSAGSCLWAGGPLPPLFLARGLGIDRLGSGLFAAGGFDGGDGGKWSVFTGSGGGDLSGAEAHYKKMVEEDPSNALILRNYAEFLYQTMGDLKRSEEYYSRAILADPGDAEILAQYAKLVWELHGDEERATSYFQQAVQAAPTDSHVLAAYAGFLWEAEDGEDGATHDVMAMPVHAEVFASAV